MPEFLGPEVQVGRKTRLETYPNASDSRTGGGGVGGGEGAARPRNPESRPGLCEMHCGSSLILHLSVLKDQLALVSDSSTITHTHTHARACTHTHTQAPGRPLLETWSLRSRRGRWLSANLEPAREGTESTRTPPDKAGWPGESTQRRPRAAGPPSSCPNPALARPPRQFLQVSTHSGASPLPAASP